MSAAPSPADPLGYDVAVTDDVPEDGRAATGEELVAWAILHRMQAKTLPLVDAPGGLQEYGVDATEWVGEATTRELAQRKAPLISVVIQRDPRIDPASIRVVGDIAGPEHEGRYALTYTVTCRTTTALPVSLVIGVSAVSVELLSQGK